VLSNVRQQVLGLVSEVSQLVMMLMWRQRRIMRKIVLSLLMVTGIVEDSEQCLSKSAITEAVDEAHVQIEQPVLRREREPPQPIALRSVHRSLFRPPQHLLYGFTPFIAEKWENVQSFTKMESYQSNAEPKQGHIELLNVLGPPYNHQTNNHIHSQKQRSIVQTANNKKRNIGYSTKFQPLKFPHGSGIDQHKQNSLKDILGRESPKRPDPFKDEIKTQKDLRRKLKNFNIEPIQNFPGFESFSIDFWPKQVEH
jgi:hypothetical protein